MRNYQSRTPSMSKEEAIQLHAEALVIDAQQPPATTGFLFNSAMQAELERMNLAGYTREEAHSRLLKLAANEIQNNYMPSLFSSSSVQPNIMGNIIKI